MRISVNTKSIDKAIRQIQRYQKSLDTLVRRVMKRMTDEGLEILNAKIGSINTHEVDTSVVGSVEINAIGDGNYEAKINMTGRDVAFIEFGSGVKYNTSIGGSLHPKGQELGMTIGSYPHQKNADNPNGWYYDGEHHFGSETFMPLYTTEKELSEKIENIAREVFNEFK